MLQCLAWRTTTDWAQINIYPDPKKFDAMCRKLWSTVTVQKVLQQRTNALWLYDGKKLAWAPVDIADLRIEVDLDNDGIPENQRKPPKMGRDGKPRVSVYSLIMRRTTSINLAVLPAYLNGQMGWSESLLEAMSE
jgi:eukaryotic translation initiation factor 2C